MNEPAPHTVAAQQSRTAAPHQGDAQPPTVLRSILENLERMFQAYLMALSEGAHDALLLAICREAAMVTVKLHAMHRRWHTFLPFQEVIDVDFAFWLGKVRNWMREFSDHEDDMAEGYDVLQPDNGFLLDLLQSIAPDAADDVPTDAAAAPETNAADAAAPEAAGLRMPQIPPILELDRGELDQAIESYFTQVDRLLAARQLPAWEEQLPRCMAGPVQDVLGRLRDSDRLIGTIYIVLTDLANELQRIDTFFSSALRSQQFVTLALRLKHRDCQQAIDEGMRELTRAANAWPDKYRKARAAELKEKLKMKLITQLGGDELSEYIDLDYPDLYGDACFGQYLFKNRHHLTREMVQETVKCCHMISHLNHELDPRGTARKKREAALGRELSEQERDILRRLEELARLGHWSNGATADSIILGLGRMLGIGYTLEPGMQRLSDQLWDLLKSRKNCDAAKSLRITWLNIVGWCVSKSYISGGSPALCKTFFPGIQDQDAYKAIDKGRSASCRSRSFNLIVPLLERFLK